MNLQDMILSNVMLPNRISALSEYYENVELQNIQHFDSIGCYGQTIIADTNSSIFTPMFYAKNRWRTHRQSSLVSQTDLIVLSN